MIPPLFGPKDVNFMVLEKSRTDSHFASVLFKMRPGPEKASNWTCGGSICVFAGNFPEVLLNMQ